MNSLSFYILSHDRLLNTRLKMLSVQRKTEVFRQLVIVLAPSLFHIKKKMWNFKDNNIKKKNFHMDMNGFCHQKTIPERGSTPDGEHGTVRKSVKSE